MGLQIASKLSPNVRQFRRISGRFAYAVAGFKYWIGTDHLCSQVNSYGGDASWYQRTIYKWPYTIQSGTDVIVPQSSDIG